MKNTVPAQEIKALIQALSQIRQYAEKLSQRFAPEIQQMPENYRLSGLNLLHYLALRHQDIRDLQKRLGYLGTSRLGKAESHVMASIRAVEDNLRRIIDAEIPEEPSNFLSFTEGEQCLKNHAKALFGENQQLRQTRIMVTLPSEAANNYSIVYELLQQGMDCARINCAHDQAKDWLNMIRNLRKAQKATGKACKIAMDLSGPKLRTGNLYRGAEVRKLRPLKNGLGQVQEALKIWLIPEAEAPDNLSDILPIRDKEWLSQIQVGEVLTLKDLRGKQRQCKVIASSKSAVQVSISQTCYLKSGHKIRRKSAAKKSQAIGRIGNLPAQETYISLNVGDTLRICAEDCLGQAAQRNEKGEVLHPAFVSCPIPELFTEVRVGERILFDDGKIEGRIELLTERYLEAKITYVKGATAKLKSDKGINLPESQLSLRGLTEKDREDLKFIVKHADIVNFSFVNIIEDVIDLQKALQALRAPESFGVIYKIETQRAVENLPGILLHALQRAPIGVMIARGDLAVECGWQQLAEVQEEILRICEAAHVPIIWATQVLESVAKKGRPSRAEITDAAMSQRAECVMLNKGAYILTALEMLAEILSNMDNYHQKKAPMLPTLKMPQIFEV